MQKESKAARIERIKREKDGLDVIDNIYRYAQCAQRPDAEDIDRFKWYGLYTQNRNLQKVDDPTLYFMLRVKLEAGALNLEQVGMLGYISRAFARDSADFTTRQDLQFHWIRLADLPVIFELLDSVGLSTQQAAGDCPRNVVSCPVNGIDHESVADVRHLVEAVNELFRANRNFSNLPRKFKVGISGCSGHCIAHEIHDLSFNARRIGSDRIVYEVYVGGGLAKNRRIASLIGSVQESQVIAVVEAVAMLYRDHGNRENRSKARVGHLIEACGLEHFVKALHAQLGFALEPIERRGVTPSPIRGHFGIHRSKTRHRSYIGCAVTAGRIGAAGLLELTEIMSSHKVTQIKVTTAQNFVILDVPTGRAEAVEKALERAGLAASATPFQARTLACTGLNFCKLAISETKALAHTIVGELNRRFPAFGEPVSISVNGCANACAHPHIVDIGLIGAVLKRGEVSLHGFELVVGGYLAGEASCFARKTGIRVAPEEAVPLIVALLQEYLQSGDASLGEFLRKRSYEERVIPSVA